MKRDILDSLCYHSDEDIFISRDFIFIKIADFKKKKEKEKTIFLVTSIEYGSTWEKLII